MRTRKTEPTKYDFMTSNELRHNGYLDAMADQPRKHQSPAYWGGYDAGMGMRFPLTDGQREINARRSATTTPWMV